MELNIDPAEINKYVADKILDSTLGDAVKKVIAKELETLGRSYDNPLDRAIREEVHRMLLAVVRDEYADKLREAIRARLSDEAVNEVAGKAMDLLLGTLKR